jgi:hypothetical protein
MTLAELSGLLTVVADEHGAIIATVHHAQQSSPDAPTHFAIRPAPGQHVHTLRMPAELAQLGIAERSEELHRAYELYRNGVLRSRHGKDEPRH